jgi:hypothetical protein
LKLTQARCDRIFTTPTHNTCYRPDWGTWAPNTLTSIYLTFDMSQGLSGNASALDFFYTVVAMISERDISEISSSRDTSLVGLLQRNLTREILVIYFRKKKSKGLRTRQLLIDLCLSCGYCAHIGRILTVGSRRRRHRSSWQPRLNTSGVVTEFFLIGC